jgi:hypothetical protein
MMKSFYVIGSQQKENVTDYTKDWYLYQKGLVLRIDPEYGSSKVCVEHDTQSYVGMDEEELSIEFKAGTIREGKLYVCTRNEVLIYDLRKFERVGYISLPCFNDLHHVCPTQRESLLIANTGLDMVLEITPNGKVLREWNVLGEDPWERFSRDIDYRKVATTKPHRSHPNFIFQVHGDVWVTRFAQKDAICLTQPNQHIKIDIERPHDGIVYENFVYFTTVDGHIVIANLMNRQIEQVVNLNEITEISDYSSIRPLGWCRGLKVLDREHIIVGFTKLRRTKWRENVHWIKRRFGIPAGKMPTRVALYNLKHRKLCWEKNLQENGMDTVFSIHLCDSIDS